MQASTVKGCCRPPLSGGKVFFIVVGLASGLGLAAPSPGVGQEDCCITGPMGSSNVCWSLPNNIAACPAGDAVVAGRPSRLVIDVWYMTPGCTGPRVGVPPESILVTTSATAGNLQVNDKGAAVYADDSTDAEGHTTITIPSFSGCGTLHVSLNVGGVNQGLKHVVVRSTDMNADGRATSAGDLPATCDLNYDGEINAFDGSIVLAHPDHWHRHSLHGTLVRRTNLKDFGGGGQNNTIGVGGVAWSPNGLRIAFSARDTCPESCSFQPNPCRIKWVFSNPELGTSVFNLTFNGAAADSMDYNPSWSPRGGYVYYDRADVHIRRKGVPGLSADTTDVGIIGGSLTKTQAHVSPDGDSLAYIQVVSGLQQVLIAPATGGSGRQLTSSTNEHWSNPDWSPDGVFLIATRQDLTTLQNTLWKIPVRLDPPTPVRFYPPAGDGATDARWPSVSPDGLVIAAGVGPTRTSPHTTHTIDGTAQAPAVAIQNYPAHTFNSVHPRISPDGARLALLARDPEVSGTTLPQVWAARRNMSEPPRITKVGTQNVTDTTVTVAISAKRGLQTSVQVLATDSEGDAITCSAAFLQDGMNFDPSTCTLSWTPSAPVGTQYHVVLRVATNTWPNGSGGGDAILAEFTVTDPILAPGVARGPIPEEGSDEEDGPTLTRGGFSVRAPFISGTVAELAVFDLAGRRVAGVSGRAGSPLVWNGEDTAGALVPNGVYLYRLTAGKYLKTGRLVIVR